jgi:hypothetical protein
MDKQQTNKTNKQNKQNKQTNKKLDNKSDSFITKLILFNLLQINYINTVLGY